MSTELKIYKFNLTDASREVDYLIEEQTFNGAKILSLKTEVWKNVLIVVITVFYDE